eukprot:scaffold42426_cov226-Skeletonema_marinoi.AAC.1
MFQQSDYIITLETLKVHYHFHTRSLHTYEIATISAESERTLALILYVPPSSRQLARLLHLAYEDFCHP